MRILEIRKHKINPRHSPWDDKEWQVTLKKIRDITFMNARDVLGIIYNSKTGNTSLKWRQIRRMEGKVTGEASPNSLTNLAEAGVLTLDWVENYLKKKAEESKTTETTK